MAIVLVNSFFFARFNPGDQHLEAERLRILVKKALMTYSGRGVGLLFEGRDGLPPPIDLNLATEEELDLLPGIGPKTALFIIEARYGSGFFLTKEELLKPYGPLAPSTYWAILPYVK